MSGGPIVCLTFDFDAMSVWLGPEVGLSTPALMSRGEFGGRVGVPRILRMLERRGIPATFFVPGHTLDSFPEESRAIRDAGHELGHHGYLHESPVNLERDEERRVLERGFEAFDRVLGLRPRGYRSPSWDLSPNTVELLVEHGFLYDSSLMAHDFQPYLARVGDDPHAEQGYGWGKETDLVEVPVYWTLDDFPQLEFASSPRPTARTDQSAIAAMWKADFDFMREEEPTGVFTLTLHPQVIARASRLRLLESVLDHMASANAHFLRLGEAVTTWQATQS
jgi:peptidoglycan-N-acetylglucosamine deacetylase